MIRVLFICHGNICRSVMAQMMMLDYVKKLELDKDFLIDSMAVSSEEIGNTIYPKALKELNRHNIKSIPHKAKKFTIDDYDNFDYILYMDYSNLRRLNNICEDKDNKYKLLLSYAFEDKEISDPWYTDNFSLCYYDLKRGIECFINFLNNRKLI